MSKLTVSKFKMIWYYFEGIWTFLRPKHCGNTTDAKPTVTVLYGFSHIQKLNNN